MLCQFVHCFDLILQDGRTESHENSGRAEHQGSGRKKRSEGGGQPQAKKKKRRRRKGREEEELSAGISASCSRYHQLHKVKKSIYLI